MDLSPRVGGMQIRWGLFRGIAGFWDVWDEGPEAMPIGESEQAALMAAW